MEQCTCTFTPGPITIPNRWPKFRRLKSSIGDLMYYDYDHRLVIKILKVKVADWLPNATGLKKPPLTYEKCKVSTVRYIVLYWIRIRSLFVYEITELSFIATISWYRRLNCTFALSNHIFYLLTNQRIVHILSLLLSSNYQRLNDSAAYVCIPIMC